MLVRFMTLAIVPLHNSLPFVTLGTFTKLLKHLKFVLPHKLVREIMRCSPLSLWLLLYPDSVKFSIPTFLIRCPRIHVACFIFIYKYFCFYFSKIFVIVTMLSPWNFQHPFVGPKFCCFMTLLHLMKKLSIIHCHTVA